MANTPAQQQMILARLARIHITDLQAAPLALSLDPDVVRHISDSDLLRLINAGTLPQPVDPYEPAGLSTATKAALAASYVKYAEGTLAAQPTAAVFGVGLYKVTDVNGGQIQHSDGTAWTNVAPGVSQAATPALVAGPATRTSNFTTTSTIDVDVPSLSAPFTAVAGASYWLWLKAAIGNTVSGASASLSLTDSSGNVLDTTSYQAKSNNDNAIVVLAAVVSPGAGSYTPKARLHASASTAFVLAGATFPPQLQVLRVA